MIVGPYANDLIHEGALAIANGLGVDSIARTIHAHPTLSEAFMEAVHGLENKAIHIAPKKAEGSRHYVCSFYFSRGFRNFINQYYLLAYLNSIDDLCKEVFYDR